MLALQGHRITYFGHSTFSLTTPSGQVAIIDPWVGDTTIAELYKPELAMLPIGDRFTMGPREAAYAIRLLGVKHVIPMHYGTFPFLTGTVDGLRRETPEIAGLGIPALKPGESL